MCLKEAGVPITPLDRTLPDMFSTFNYSASAQSEPTGSVCLMMGRPKPHEIETGWVRRNWSLSATDRDVVTPQRAL
jgi:hypothetical protein